MICFVQSVPAHRLGVSKEIAGIQEGIKPEQLERMPYKSIGYPSYVADDRQLRFLYLQPATVFC